MSNESIVDKSVELLEKVSEGDEEAFRQLYDLTHKKVYFYLYRLFKVKESAEDALVETYTEVWRGAKSFKGKSLVTTWIMGIARHLASSLPFLHLLAKKRSSFQSDSELKIEGMGMQEGFKYRLCSN